MIFTWSAEQIFGKSQCLRSLLLQDLAPYHGQMPHNAIASQAASATLLTPLAAVRLNAVKFYRQKYKCLVTINDGDGGKGECGGREEAGHKKWGFWERGNY